jgi:cbb3-type cytochrome oxidase subunit 1
MSIAGVARRLAMVSAPLALIAFSFLHGSFSWAETQHLHTASNEEWISHLSKIKERWLIIHVAGVFLFPLLGLSASRLEPFRSLARSR